MLHVDELNLIQIFSIQSPDKTCLMSTFSVSISD